MPFSSTTRGLGIYQAADSQKIFLARCLLPLWINGCNSNVCQGFPEHLLYMAFIVSGKMVLEMTSKIT